MTSRAIKIEPLYEVFRVRLLTYVPESEAPSLAETLSGGLNDASTAYPRGDFRILNVRRQRNTDAPFYTAELELTLYDQGAAKAIALEGLADIANEALSDFVDLPNGVFEVTPRDRDTAKPMSERADPDVVENVSTFDLILFPASA